MPLWPATVGNGPQKGIHISIQHYPSLTWVCDPIHYSSTFPAEFSVMRHSLSVHPAVLSVAAVCRAVPLERPWQREKCFTLLKLHTFTTIREDSSQTSSISWESLWKGESNGDTISGQSNNFLLPHAHAHTRGKVSYIVITIAVNSKIARSRDLGTWVTHNHNEAIKLGDNLHVRHGFRNLSAW